MKLHEIRAKRTAVAAEMRGLLDKADSETRALTADEASKFDALKSEVNDLDAAEERAATLEEIERKMNGTPVAKPATPAEFHGLKLRAQDGSIVRALDKRDRVIDTISRTTLDTPENQAAAELGLGGYIRALLCGARTDTERRALGGAAIGTGGATVPTPLAGEHIDALRARSVCMQAGARTIPMTSATLKFARGLTFPTGSWRAESGAITDSDPSFDQLTLTAKSWAVMQKVPRELLEDSVNINEVLRQILGAAGALALDSAILVGSGSSNQPLGIHGTSGIQSVSMGANGAAFTTWSPVLDAVQALETANAGDVTAMVLHPRTARAINGLLDTTNQPLVPPPRIASIPRLVTTGVPINQTQGASSVASSIYLGDFREVFVGMRTELMITLHPDRYAENGQVAFVTWMRADVAIARPAAMGRIIGVL